MSFASSRLSKAIKAKAQVAAILDGALRRVIAAWIQDAVLIVAYIHHAPQTALLAPSPIARATRAQ